MRGKTYAMLLGFAVFTGATFNLAKYAVHYFSAANAAGWRFGIAATVLVFILGIQKKIRWGILREYGGIYAILGIIGVFGFNSFFFSGIKYTSPLNGALIMATNPLLTTILAYFILKNPLTKRQMLGIIFALTGVILVLTQGSWEIIRTLSLSMGDLLILFGNLCWALYGVLGRKYLHKSSSMETTTYTMIIGAVCLIVLSAFLPSPPLSKVTVSAWGAILFMAIFTSVLGYLWWNKGMETIGASNTSLFFNLVPVVTMILSILTGTAITIAQVLGTILVILGVLTSTGILKLKKDHTLLSQSTTKG
ncbi:EamA family transporter [Bacillus sp. BRMEA1]|uniref:DMT family transporter n=1 Tax=Neobacillus endophyticus TaxID=2738405 RepID=UPI0015637361|nr:EamA family transporter [Neobacillus endophyticus]NRD77100.1 EamA family transporter [Neobacillus endophyticus]